MGMQPTPQSGQIQMTYVDRLEISETFADSLVRAFFDGITLRMEFVVNRMDDPQPGQPPSGRSITAARLVMPLSSVLDMIARLQTMIGQLQAQGVVRQVHIPPGSQQTH